jgi:hypothetical protein
MNGWGDLEMARQRQEDLLREACERRLARTARGAGRSQATLGRRLLGLLQTEEEQWNCLAAEDGIAPAPEPDGRA